MATKGRKEGRVIRRYRNRIPIEEFPIWQDLMRTNQKGCGLYALYHEDTLMYVGLADKSIRSRIARHRTNPNKPFTHFSVFLVTGTDTEARTNRIRDLEALLLNLIHPRPEWNQSTTQFIGAKTLELEELKQNQ